MSTPRKNRLWQSVVIAGLLCVPLFPASAAELPTLAQSEALVREMFADTPVMISIAKCESSFRQYTNSGGVFRGSGVYVGVFQINEKIHTAAAKNLGMDILTLEGNLAYAKYLYSQAGTRPWAGCVPKTDPTETLATPTVVSATPALTRNLKIGVTDPQVQALQKILNAAGFIIAASGPGSIGNETTTFGALTRAAVQRFQCEKKIVCDGNESTTGYGAVGPKTRAVLLQTK
jgi:predicted nucleic acid-binding Zn ribbon protein